MYPELVPSIAENCCGGDNPVTAQAVDRVFVLYSL